MMEHTAKKISRKESLNRICILKKEHESKVNINIMEISKRQKR